MIPLASWLLLLLLLRGRCRTCQGSIGAWHPAVELITGALFVIMAR